MDRDGNSLALVGKNDSLKLLAMGLKDHGYASLRCDSCNQHACITHQTAALAVGRHGWTANRLERRRRTGWEKCTDFTKQELDTDERKLTSFFI
jgi:hypothetical protein